MTSNLLEVSNFVEITEVNDLSADNEFQLIRGDGKYMFLIENKDTSDCMIRFDKNFGDPYEVVIPASKTFACGNFESMYFKQDDGKMKFHVLDTDGTPFSGTVSNVKFTVLEHAKSLVD